MSGPQTNPVIAMQVWQLLTRLSVGKTCLRGGGQGALCTLCRRLQPPHSTRAARGVLLVLALELLQHSMYQVSQQLALGCS